MHDKNLHRFPVIGFAFCLFMAWAAESIFGVADIIGAFAAGLIIAMTPKKTYIDSKINPLSYLLLSPVFFATIGLGVSFTSMDGSMILFCVVIVAVAVLTKLIGCSLGARMCGMSGRHAVQVGVGMVCRGEVALIVAQKGVALGILPEDFFGPIVIMVVVCSIMTPIFLKVAFRDSNSKHHDIPHLSDLLHNYQLRSHIDVLTHSLIKEKQIHGKDGRKPTHGKKKP